MRCLTSILMVMALCGCTHFTNNPSCVPIIIDQEYKGCVPRNKMPAIFEAGAS